MLTFVLSRTVSLRHVANVLLLNYLGAKVMFFSKRKTKIDRSFFVLILLAGAKM